MDAGCGCGGVGGTFSSCGANIVLRLIGAPAYRRIEEFAENKHFIRQPQRATRFEKDLKRLRFNGITRIVQCSTSLIGRVNYDLDTVQKGIVNRPYPIFEQGSSVL